jgi:hypothetical protein
MGVDYYAVIPKARLILYLGRSGVRPEDLDTDLESFERVIEKLGEIHENGADFLDKRVNELTVSDLLEAFSIYRDLQEVINEFMVILKYYFAKMLDEDSYVISDMDEEYKELMEKVEKGEYVEI